MAIVANPASKHKAPTGPNPQNRKPLNQTVTTVGTDSAQTGKALAAKGQTPLLSGSFTQPGLKTAPGAAQPQQPGQPPQPITYDYSSDPILQQVTAAQQTARHQYEQDALAQQKQALIAYGDPNLARSVLGDELTAQAAAANPGSTLAQLAAGNKTNVRGINEAENKANLFYSSDAGYQLGLAQKTYLGQQGAAADAVQGSLGSIGTNLLAHEQASYDAQSQASSDAYDRAVKNPGLYASGGAPSTTPASSSPAAAGPAKMPLLKGSFTLPALKKAPKAKAARSGLYASKPMP